MSLTSSSEGGADQPLMIALRLVQLSVDGSVSLRAGRCKSCGGNIIVNPSVGLLSRGHPVGATGVVQTVKKSASSEAMLFVQ